VLPVCFAGIRVNPSPSRKRSPEIEYSTFADHARGQRALRIESSPLETARVRLGQFADALVLDQQATSERAMRLLGWAPRAPSLIEDLQSGSYATS
jgi:hypothetical protein